MTFVFNVVSTNGQRWQISDLGPENTVNEINEKLEEVAGINHDMILLLFKGKKLEKTSTLSQCGIDAGCTINLVLALRAGAD